VDDWYDNLRRQVEETPPRCLNGFDARPGGKVHGNSEWCSWELRCRCGNETGRVLGYSAKERNPDDKGPEMFLSPLAFECPMCGERTEIVDVAEHGYDAEICKTCTTMRGEGPRIVLACANCSKTEFKVVTNFLHSHFDHIEDEPALAPRAQDFFDGFGCAGTCKNCGHDVQIANYELA